MSKVCLASAIVLAVVALAYTPSRAQVLLYENYDTETVNTLPDGWTNTGEVTTSGVSNDFSVSGTQSFMIEHDGNDPSGFTLNAFRLRQSFTPHTLDATSKTLTAEFDIRVDQIGDGSEGFIVQVWTGNSGLPNGDARIFRGTPADFYFQSSDTVGPIPQDQWHHFRIEFDATSNTDGQVRWNLNNNVIPVATENWSGQGPAQMSNLQFFDIRGVQTAAGSGSRMYIDNLFISIPEPGSLCLLGTTTLAMLRRRRRVRTFGSRRA